MSDGCDPPKRPWLMFSVCLKRLGRKQHNCNKQGKHIRLLALSVDNVSDIVGNRSRAKLASARSLENEMEELGRLVSYDEPDKRQLRDLAERG